MSDWVGGLRHASAATVLVAAATQTLACGREAIRFDEGPQPEALEERRRQDPAGPGYRPEDGQTIDPELALAGLPLTGAQIDVLGDIEFDTNSASIKQTPRNVGLLETLVTAGRTFPQITKLRVEGHTDSDGDDASNQQLSERRAMAVVDWLVSRGVERNRLLAVGCGERDPLVPNTSAENKQTNRRTEFDIEDVNGRRFSRATEHCAPNSYRRAATGHAGWDTSRATFAVERSVYGPLQTIRIKYSHPMNAPEGQQFWITLVQATATDDTLGAWHYVPRGATTDELTTLASDKSEEFEIRLHDLYPKHKHRVLQRVKVTVKPDEIIGGKKK